MEDPSQENPGQSISDQLAAALAQLSEGKIEETEGGA